MLEARSAEARPRIRGEASLEARSAGAARARAAFDAAQLRRFASPSFVSLRPVFFFIASASPPHYFRCESKDNVR